MHLVELIEKLSDTAAYPHAPDGVEVLQTHISVVFLAGSFAYKIKKPVDLGFLDFSTLEKRRHFCDEEVRLNRRLAPAVYLGVVPVTGDAKGLRIEGTGEAVEWAVKMERLPESATLLKRLERGELDAKLLDDMARRLADFHATAEAGERVAAFGRLAVVARNALENFEQSRPQIGITLSRNVFSRLSALTEAELALVGVLIEDRARRGMPRDTHGDLHLDHVYFFPDRESPAHLVIVDCIEFNERFRYADPVADMAFLAMDLRFRRRDDLARDFCDAYFRYSGDEEGRKLLPFYIAYRSAVRAKVEGFELAEKEISTAERAAALSRSRAHWLLALGILEQPARRPCLVLVGGLPGAGKSTLAAALADAADFQVIRTDQVRKELAGAGQERSNQFGEGLYSTAWDEHTYTECLHRSASLLFEGRRVLVDASFREEKRRRAFLDLAARWGVPVLFLLCQADANTVRQRLSSRRNDISDADWAIYEQMVSAWETPQPATRRVLREISTEGEREQVVSKACDALREQGLLG
jgi:aminoglycoside phosphotransferase family enzyme/predicted kinase